MKSISVGICQLKQGYDFKKNLSQALSMIDEAVSRGAEIVILPEMFFTPYEPASIRSSAGLSPAAVEILQEKSAGSGIYIVAGSMPVQGDGTRFYNTSFVFGPDGHQVYRHDKMHLFDCSVPGGPRVKESNTIIPGNSYGAFDTPWGRASVIVCYDIRFTNLIQLLVDQGIKLLFVPAAFSPATGTAHWEMLVRMRSVEIQGFVIGVQPAYNPDLKYIPYGHSIIASPWGEIILDAGQQEVVEVVSLDLTEVDTIRRKFPLLAHRRKDLYSVSWSSKQ